MAKTNHNKVNKGYFVQNLKTVDERVLNNFFRLAAKVYNEALFFHKKYYETYQRFPTWNIVYDKIIKGKNGKLMGSSITTSIIRNLDINFKNYFKNKNSEGNLKKPGYRKKDFFVSFFGCNMMKVLENGTLSLYLGQDFQRKYNCTSFLNIQIPKNFHKSKKSTQIRLEENNGKYRIIWTYPVEVETNYKETKMGIDLGMDQLFACYFHNENKNLRPMLISGKKIKNINYHMLNKIHKEESQTKQDNLYLKRKNMIEHELNKYIKYLFKVAVSRGVEEIYIGFFKNIKENKVAQHFFYMPHSVIRRKIRDYGLKHGIKTYFDDESYTSKTSFLDLESPEKQDNYIGKRVQRGLFRTGEGSLINADVNGAAQILVKLSKCEIKNRDNILLHPISVRS